MTFLRWSKANPLLTVVFAAILAGILQGLPTTFQALSDLFRSLP